MMFGNLAAQRQADAAAFVAGATLQALEDLKQPVTLPGLNADAVIGDR